MRSKDLHMAATIDLESKTIMVSGSIDVNDAIIVMRVPVPEPGRYTLIKAETNLTDQPWCAWQIGLGDGVTLPVMNPTNMLLSRQFRKCKYNQDRASILFYDGEVRPGDAIFKMAHLDIAGPAMILSHGRATPSLWDFPVEEETDVDQDNGFFEPDKERSDRQDKREQFHERMLMHGFGHNFPRIEVETPVRIVQPGDIDLASFANTASYMNSPFITGTVA